MEKHGNGHQTGNFMEKTEGLLIAAQNKSIRTNFVKMKIDDIQWNNKYKFFRERDKTIDHIVSECSKLP